jgi:hypothetical protein
MSCTNSPDDTPPWYSAIVTMACQPTRSRDLSGRLNGPSSRWAHSRQSGWLTATISSRRVLASALNISYIGLESTGQGAPEPTTFSICASLKSGISTKTVVGMAVPPTKNPPISGYDLGIVVDRSFSSRASRRSPVHGITFHISLIYNRIVTCDNDSYRIWI